MNAAVSKVNEKPVKDAACAHCNNPEPLVAVKVKPATLSDRMLVESDFLIVYHCPNANCKNYGNLTALYRFGSGNPEV